MPAANGGQPSGCLPKFASKPEEENEGRGAYKHRRMVSAARNVAADETLAHRPAQHERCADQWDETAPAAADAERRTAVHMEAKLACPNYQVVRAWAAATIQTAIPSPQRPS